MPWIKFIKEKPPIEVASGAQLMKSLPSAGLPVASSCHGDGICAKCRIRIVAGKENLSPVNAREEILRGQNPSLPSDARISCQTWVHGDVTVDASYW